MIKFFHDDSMIVSCSNDRTVRFWDIKSGECVHSKLAHSDSIFSLDLTHNN
jgi:striatin 1/3/4